jgi:hypothetical protein
MKMTNSCIVKEKSGLTLQEFILNPPKTIRVYCQGTQAIILLNLTPEGNRYITNKNMGTANKRVFHYWSFENAYRSIVNKK